MTRPYKPTGIPSLIPYLIVRNAQESISFYKDACQFQLMKEPSVQNGQIIHVEMALGDSLFMMAPEGACAEMGKEKKSPKSQGVASGLTLYVYVPNVDEHYKNAKQKGAEILSEPEDTFWGDRCYTLRDPDGYEWCFGTNTSQHK